jgi:lipopolysaccharide export system permease protein
MSIITKYVCRRLLTYYLAFLLMMVAFFVFVDFMEHIGRITKHHTPLSLIGLYYLCFLPRLFAEMSWLSFLVAMLFVLGSLARNNEFTAMMAGGISMYAIAAPLLIIGVLLSAGVFCIQEFLVPATLLRAYKMKETDFVQESREPRIFNIAGTGKRNRFYFFDVVNVEEGVLTGVHIHTRKSGTIVERIDADRAVWDKSTARWHLENGTIKKLDDDGVVMSNIPFLEMNAPFRESPKTLEVHSLDERELNFRQLRDQIKNLQKSGYDAQRLKVDYHMKFSLPLANLIVVFLGLPFALECRVGGLAVGFALSLISALLYYGAFQIGLALGKGGSLPAAAAAWLPNFLFLAFGAGLTLRTRT